MIRRPPDFVIGDPDKPYLRRWWVIPRNKWFNIYLHHFLASDDDRALHDHPWVNVSILLRGSYIEHTPKKAKLRIPFCPVVRGPRAAHRVALLQGGDGCEQPVWSLFITGPVVRQWGFHCPQGWRHWKDFVAPGTGSGTGGSQRGKGCGD